MNATQANHRWLAQPSSHPTQNKTAAGEVFSHIARPDSFASTRDPEGTTLSVIPTRDTRRREGWIPARPAWPFGVRRADGLEYVPLDRRLWRLALDLLDPQAQHPGRDGDLHLSARTPIHQGHADG